MATITLIKATTDASADKVLRTGRYGSVLVTAVGLAANEAVILQIDGALTSERYREGGSVVALTAENPTADLPVGPNYRINKSNTSAAVAVLASVADNGSRKKKRRYVDLLDDSTAQLASFITFTRSSTAMRYNSAGLLETVAANAPRYDYDPATVTRANLLLRSQEFDASVWNKLAAGTGIAPVVTANYGIAPDGTLTADRVQFNVGAGTTGSDISYIQQLFGSVPTAAGSIWIKTADGSTKTITFRVGGVLTQVIVTPEWTRYEEDATNATRIDVLLYGNVGGGGTADLLLWGAQLEAGSTATAYIPTGVLERGNDLVTNGGFGNGLTGWTDNSTAPAAASLSGGGVRLLRSGSGAVDFRQSLPAVVAGKAYEISFDVLAYGGVGSMQIRLATTGSAEITYTPTASDVGRRVSFYAVALVGGSVSFLRSFDVDLTIDNISVREINSDYASPRGDATLRGLLVEEQRTNLLLRSQEFDNASWLVATGTASKTANTDIAPDGTLTADTLTATSAGAVVWQTYTPVESTVYVASMWVKRKVGTGAVEMTVDGGTTYQAITINSDTFTRIALPPYTATAGTKAVGLRFATSGDAVAVWGAQLEAGAFATSYIPTTIGSVSRAQDVSSASGSAIGHNAGGGTLLVTAYAPPGVGVSDAGIVAMNSGVSGDRWILFRGPDRLIKGSSRSSASPGFAGDAVVTGVVPDLNEFSAALSIGGGEISISRDGGSAVTDSAATYPAGITSLDIGRSGFFGGQYFNGHIRRLRYYPRRLPNSTLQALTA